MSQETLPEYVDGLPNISGSEDLVAETMARSGPFYLPEFGIISGASEARSRSRSICTSR